MVYAGRSRDSLPFLDELNRFGDRIEIHTDDRSGIRPLETCWATARMAPPCMPAVRRRC